MTNEYCRPVEAWRSDLKVIVQPSDQSSIVASAGPLEYVPAAQVTAMFVAQCGENRIENDGANRILAGGDGTRTRGLLRDKQAF